MLSSRDKQKIKSEEYYRAKIQKILTGEKDPKTWFAKFIKFFNTPLGICILSSVIIASLTWGYTLIQSWRETETRRTENVNKLRREMLTRIENVQLEIYLDRRAPESKLDVKRYVSRLLSPPGVERAVVPEFANRNTQSLIYELISITGGDEKQEAGFVKDDIEFIQPFLTPQTTPEQDLDRFEKKMEELYDHLIKIPGESVWRIKKL